MATKIGLHIGRPEALNNTWLDKFQSAVHLILALNINGEIPVVQAVANRCPNSTIIYRAYDYGGLGQSDHFAEYYTQHGANPLPLIQAHEPTFNALKNINYRIGYQIWNETGDSDNDWAHFVEFNTNYIKEMDRRGLSATVLGTGPGRPSGTREEIRAKWEVARPMFEAINNATHPHYLNMHEYIGYPHTLWKPFLCGRYSWLLEDLADMGLLTDKVRIFAGEIGWANPAVLDPKYPSNPANGYRGFLMLGVTPEQLAEDLHVAFKTVYTDPHFIGSAIFTFGAYGWEDFDLLLEPRILQRLYELISEETMIIDTPVIEFKVINGPLNIRTNYATSAPIVGQYQVGEIIKTNGYVDTGTFRWRRIDGTGNWCAEYGTSGVVFLEEYVPPVPVWKTEVKELLDDIRFEIISIQNELINLQTIIDNA